MLRTRLENDGRAAKLVYFDTNAQSHPCPIDYEAQIHYADNVTHEASVPVLGRVPFVSYIQMLFATVLLSSGQTESSSMDIWRKVKIPFLHPSAGSDWRRVSSAGEVGSTHYTAFVGILVKTSFSANITFSLESSYTQLEALNVTRQPDYGNSYLYYDPLFTMGETSMDLDSMKNDTWYGFDLRPDSIIGSWSIAASNFVDKYWRNSTLMEKRFGWIDIPFDFGTIAAQRLLMFKNETGIEVRPAKLLLHTETGLDPKSMSMMQL